MFFGREILIVRFDLPDVLASIIISLIFIIIGIIWKYLFPEFKKKKVELVDKKQENKVELYVNIFGIIVFFFVYLIGLWIGIIVYFAIVFGELLVFYKFKNNNVTWAQIIRFILMTLFGGLFILFVIIANVA